MSSNAIFNAAPMPYLRGIRDESRGVNVRDPEQLPTHLPHIYIYAQKGPTEPLYCADGSAATIFGAKSFDSRFKYYNHQTVLATTVQGEGNGVFIQRLIPADAGPKARVLLSADIVADDIQQHQRDVTGAFTLDNDGNKIPLTGGSATKPGHKIKWVVNQVTAGSVTQEFGEVTSRVGSMTGAGSAQSTIYPIMEFEVHHVGEYGNDIAVRLTAPTADSEIPLNSDAVAAIKSYIYRLQILQRDNAQMTPNLVSTIFGDQWVDFALNPDAIDTQMDRDYSFGERVIEQWSDMSAPGEETPIYGPFGRTHLYTDYLKAVLAMIGELEAPEGLLPVDEIADDTSEYLYSVNPFTGVNYNNTPYYTLEVVGAAGGGQRFTDNSQVYATGGSDGTMNNDAFDLLVRNEMSNYGYTEWPLLNWAKYPMSAYYDTGFKLDTKYAFFQAIARRKDVGIVLGTHIVDEPQLLPSEESSMAMSLNNMARNFPESTLYGTSVVRAIIVGNSGRLISGSYRGFLPLTIEIARKFAAYMGAGTGRWESTKSFDQVPNNQMTMFKDVNARWKPEVTRYRDWDNGLVWVEDYDRRAKFFPAVQTVYSDDTSVLNGAAAMWIAIDLQKVAQRSWRDMTGGSKLSNAQFIERSNERINEWVRGRYDERAVIVPRTFFNQADAARGYSWSCEIYMHTGNMKTAGSFTIVARRLDALYTEPAA